VGVGLRIFRLKLPKFYFFLPTLHFFITPQTKQ
jgi:hypothetical protein